MSLNKVIACVLLLLGVLAAVVSVANEPSSATMSDVALVVQSGHFGPVQAIAVSHDGGLMATGDSERVIKLWDLAAGKELRALRGHDAGISALAFSPDDRTLVSGSEHKYPEKNIRLWDLQSGTQIKSFDGYDHTVKALKFSHDGKLLATGGLSGVRVFDIESGRILLQLDKTDSREKDAGDGLYDVKEADALSFSPDGALLASAHTGFLDISDTLVISDIREDRVLEHVPLDIRSAESVVTTFSADGKELIAAIVGRDDRLMRWRLRDGPLSGVDDSVIAGKPSELSLEGMNSGSGNIARFSSDNQLLAIGVTHKAIVVRTDTGKRVSHVATDSADPDGSLANIAALAFGPDNVLYVAGRLDRYRAVAGRIFAGHSPGSCTRAPGWRGCPEGYSSFAWSESVIWLVDAPSGKRIRSLGTSVTPVRSVRFSPDGRFLASSTNMTRSGQQLTSPAAPVRVWDLRMGKATVFETDQSGGSDAAIAFSADGQRLFNLRHRELVGWRFPEGTPEGEWKCNTIEDRTISVSPLGSIACLGPKSARIIDLASNEVTDLPGGSANLPNKSHVISNDGQWLALGGFRQIDIFDLKKKERQQTLTWERPNQYAESVVFSPDSKQLVARRGSTELIKWDTESGAELQSVDTKIGRAIAYSPTGAQIATANSDGSIDLLDPTTLEILRTLEGHEGAVNTLHFNPTGRLLASGGDDGTIKIWEAKRGTLAATLISRGVSGSIIVTPDNFYLNTKRGLAAVGFRIAEHAYPVEQFDLRFHRPDIVLGRLGEASEEFIGTYRSAYLKRLARYGLSEHDIEQRFANTLTLPQLKVVSKLPVSTTQREIRLKLRAWDEKWPLQRLQVFVNEVPLYGIEGMEIAENSTELSRSIVVPLSTGLNRIEISVTNQQSFESLRSAHNVTYLGAADDPALYVLAIGVSDYENDALDLTYAAKDATDIAAAFSATGPALFGDVHVRTLLNEEVTRERVLAERDFLQRAGVDDQVVVFLAGHGFLDDQRDFYFGTTDVDYRSPAARGLSYNDLESLVDGIAARRRLALIDSCYSGAVDASEKAKIVPPTVLGARGPLPTRGIKVEKSNAGEGLGARSVFELSRRLFANLERGTGSAVLSSTRGFDYALESPEWGNGAFTMALLEAIAEARADHNVDGRVVVSELADYVSNRVPELTSGRQIPDARWENLSLNFAVAGKKATESANDAD